MYTYHKATANGMTLHIIETDASNIKPVQLLKTSNLKGSNEYGINGGWYTSTKPDDNKKMQKNFIHMKFFERKISSADVQEL